MEMHLAVVVGILGGASLYLMLRRGLVKLVLGLALLSHAGNVLILTMGRVSRGKAPVIGPNETTLQAPYPDPLPQALILTAIVIAFGVQAFALVLIRRASEAAAKADDLNEFAKNET